MSITEKVFRYEDTELSVIKCKDDIWFRGKTIAEILEYAIQYKMAIITYPDQEKLLNKRSELISKCRHENKFLLKYYDSND